MNTPANVNVTQLHPVRVAQLHRMVREAAKPVEDRNGIVYVLTAKCRMGGEATLRFHPWRWPSAVRRMTDALFATFGVPVSACEWTFSRELSLSVIEDGWKFCGLLEHQPLSKATPALEL